MRCEADQLLFLRNENVIGQDYMYSSNNDNNNNYNDNHNNNHNKNSKNNEIIDNNNNNNDNNNNTRTIHNNNNEREHALYTYCNNEQKNRSMEHSSSLRIAEHSSGVVEGYESDELSDSDDEEENEEEKEKDKEKEENHNNSKTLNHQKTNNTNTNINIDEDSNNRNTTHIKSSSINNCHELYENKKITKTVENSTSVISKNTNLNPSNDKIIKKNCDKTSPNFSNRNEIENFPDSDAALDNINVTNTKVKNIENKSDFDCDKIININANTNSNSNSDSNLNVNCDSNSNSIFFSNVEEYFVKTQNNVEERGSEIGSAWNGNGELSLMGGDDFSFM